MFLTCPAVGNFRYLDVRNIPVAERTLHALQAFESLPPGNSFVLICDSDPHLIHLQLREDNPKHYGWVELEPAPVWQILISKGK